MENIICSQITPVGTGAVSIIRLSGKNLFNVINKYIKNLDVSKQKRNTIKYAHFINDDVVIDEILISKFIGPNSFTGEDVIEINCHGGMYVANLILKILLLDENITMASPGEFSKRAFLNNKKSLLEVNSIIDLINADNEQKYNMAISGLNGETDLLIENLRMKLMDIISVIEVSIDYPEYEDIEVLSNSELIEKTNHFISDIEHIIDDAQKGKVISSGINTLILGLPNVGKSSLFNTLNREDVAIVTSIEGTTRDVLESKINLGNLTLNLIDTAGIRETEDVVEKIGIEKGLSKLSHAQLVIIVIDGSREIKKEELDLYNSIKNVPKIVFVNKSDIMISQEYPFDNFLEISTVTKDGIESIENELLKMLDMSLTDLKEKRISLKTENIATLEKVAMIMKVAESNISVGFDIDLVELDLKEAMYLLGEILGINVKEDLLDELFSRFCLGK